MHGTVIKRLRDGLPPYRVHGSPASSPFDLKSALRAALWAFTSAWKSRHKIDASLRLLIHKELPKVIAVPRYCANCQLRTSAGAGRGLPTAQPSNNWLRVTGLSSHGFNQG